MERSVNCVRNLSTNTTLYRLILHGIQIASVVVIVLKLSEKLQMEYVISVILKLEELKELNVLRNI